MSTAYGPKGPLFPSTLRAGAAITANRAVKRGATLDDAIPATAASVNVGIAMDNQDEVGAAVGVAHRPGELVTAESGAAFALDAKLTSDATGRLITAAATNPVTAIAREAATAAGELVCVELVQSGVVVA